MSLDLYCISLCLVSKSVFIRNWILNRIIFYLHDCAVRVSVHGTDEHIFSSDIHQTGLQFSGAFYQGAVLIVCSV